MVVDGVEVQFTEMVAETGPLVALENVEFDPGEPEIP